MRARTRDETLVPIQYPSDTTALQTTKCIAVPAGFLSPPPIIPAILLRIPCELLPHPEQSLRTRLRQIPNNLDLLPQQHSIPTRKITTNRRIRRRRIPFHNQIIPVTSLRRLLLPVSPIPKVNIMPSRRRLVLTEALPAPREAGEHEEGARLRSQDDHEPALGRYARDFGLDDVGAFLRCSAGSRFRQWCGAQISVPGTKLRWTRGG